MFQETIPLSLYIHIPWCVRKCPYCDFNSHQKNGDDLPETQYIDALIADLEQDLPKIWGRRISSIFIGGGTPSLLSGTAMDKLIQALRTRLNFTTQLEITLEANPGTVEQDRFTAYRQAGINRLSIGIQSFQVDKLKKLGRIHDASEALRAIHTAREAGFDNVNLDLMFGLPQQSLEDGLFDLQTAIDQSPQHISWYQLTLEPNTLFHHQPPTLPIDEDIWHLQEAGQQLLHNAGFQQYEISAYSLNTKQCQHNRNYWEFGDYLGIGAGAHSKITQMAQQQVTRMWKRKHPNDYLNPNKPFIGEEKILDKKTLPFEFMLNALRLKQHISAELFTARTGLDWSSLTPTLTQAVEKKLIIFDKKGLNMTELGQRFLNNLMELFLHD